MPAWAPGQIVRGAGTLAQFGLGTVSTGGAERRGGLPHARAGGTVHRQRKGAGGRAQSDITADGSGWQTSSLALFPLSFVWMAVQR